MTWYHRLYNRLYRRVHVHMLIHDAPYHRTGKWVPFWKVRAYRRGGWTRG